MGIVGSCISSSRVFIAFAALAANDGIFLSFNELIALLQASLIFLGTPVSFATWVKYVIASFIFSSFVATTIFCTPLTIFDTSNISYIEVSRVGNMSMKKSSDALSKRMAELLKAGAIMLNDYCPDCHVPLFKLRDGQIICPSCNRRAFYVKEGEEYVVETMITLENLRKTITSKLSQLNVSISMEQDINQLYEETKLLLALLEVLEKLEKLSSKTN